MLKGERVASLSEAQAQSQNSYVKIRERFAKDLPKVVSASKPPLQAMGDDVASAMRCWGLGRAWVRSNPTSPSRHALWRTGSVLELRVWVKSSFESSRLGFGFEHASA